MKHWQTKSLDELGFIGRGKSKHRPRDAAHLYGGPHPFIQTSDVKHADFHITSYSQSYSDAGLAQSKLWPAGTLCITIAANIAETAILGIDACFPDSIIGFNADESKCDVRFIKYKLETIKQHYQQVSQGAAQDNLSLEKLLSFKLTVPPKREQTTIADTLTAYDDLMENNRRRMALLEESARLLYREWFVHLRYPERMKDEGGRMKDSVPQGWERVPLGEVMTLQRGHDLPSQDRVEGDIPIVSSSGITGFHDKKKADAPGVVTGRYGTLGQVYYIDRDYWPLNTALYVTDFKGNPPLYILHLLKHALESIQSDKAAIPGLNRNVVHRMNVLRPPEALRAAFGDFAADVYRQISILAQQTQKLRTARDLLLPRLMSGDIEV
jgi:type I restriction enzyme S subunit